MATISIENQPQPRLAPAVQAVLDGLRARIRRYVWLEGLTAAATWLALAFWASLAIDWFFEPPREVRAAILAASGLVLMGVLAQLVFRRAFVTLSNGNMATVLERRFPHFDDSLLTAVVLTGRQLDPAKCNPEMLAHTCRQAVERIEDVRLRKVFNPGPLRRSTSGAAITAASIVVWASLFPGAMITWAQRNLLFSDELWPRSTHLVVEDGFAGGVAKVARGADFTVIARADTRWPSIPQLVEVRYRTEGGARDRKPMSREGTADPARDRYQEYSYTFQGVLTSIRFDVVGGDDRVSDLRIEVVDSPTISEMSLSCQFPPYMGRSERTLPVTGVMQLPLGTRITVQAKANKDLVGVQVDAFSGDQPARPRLLGPKDIAADRRSFGYVVEALPGDTTLLFTLFDADGIKSREPVRLALAAAADEPPQLSVRMDGIGSAITPAVRIPLVGRITDDYSIGRVWTETIVDQHEPTSQPLIAPAKPVADLELHDAALEAGDLKLRAGQKLVLSVKAADTYDLGSGPHVGSSERWTLDVVTAEQLRTMLEARELVLRQRFEVILREVTETHDLLLRIDFAPAAGSTTGSSAEKQPAEAPGDDARQPAAEPRGAAAKGSEPGDQPNVDEKDLSPERQLALHGLRVQRALQNSRKNAHETLGVAESFDDLRKQLVNNRIDTEELKLRLESGIARPLHHIAEEMFPELQQRLDRLQEALADPQRGPQHRDRAQQQAEEILLAMQQVLDRMIALEDFNEAVELLRAIIKMQDDLHDQTKQRHKQKIRELMEK
jgi:hypothetical protein